jgi:hypothetical protein
MNPTDSQQLTDRELVLGHRPTAHIESRNSPRTDRPQCRVVYSPDAGQVAHLGPWCGTEERAWQAACLRLGLRLRRSIW